MSIDRIGTAANAQAVLAQLQRAERQLNESNRQVASGKVSSTYSGYGAKTAGLEAARSASERVDANISVAQQALSRLDLQDSQLAKLGSIADDVRSALTFAAANNDGTSLMGQLSDLFDQAVAILNTKDGNGYIYGGDRDQNSPVTISTLAQLGTAPSAASVFANGNVEKTVRIGENRTMQVGVLASDLATNLFTLLRDVQNTALVTPFGTPLSTGQQTYLQSSMTSAISTAANGNRYATVKSSIEELQATATVYKGFVANIQEVHMGEAISQLNQRQVGLQAALKVSANLSQLSLLDYLN